MGGRLGEDCVRAAQIENVVNGRKQHVVLHGPIHRRYKPEEDPHNMENKILCGVWGRGGGGVSIQAH